MIVSTEDEERRRKFIASLRLENSAYTIIRRMMQNIPHPEANGEYHFAVNSNAAFVVPEGVNPNDDDLAAQREHAAASAEKLWERFAQSLTEAGVFEKRPDRMEILSVDSTKVSILKVSGEELDMLQDINHDRISYERLQQQLKKNTVNPVPQR